jgi:hypothetical protein
LFPARGGVHRRDTLHGGISWRLLGIALAFHAVVLAWAFFRVTDFDRALACVRAAFAFEPGLAFAGGSADFALWLVVAIYAAVAAAVGGWADGDRLQAFASRAGSEGFRAGLIWGATAGVGVLAWLLAPVGQAQPFIYFQF